MYTKKLHILSVRSDAKNKIDFSRLGNDVNKMFLCYRRATSQDLS